MAFIKSSIAPRALFSLYRSLLRQVQQLPHYYLREFFRIKVGEDIRSILHAKQTEKVRISKVRRVRQELLRLERANLGQRKSIDHILDLAYGRKGPLKWSMMKPLLTDPTSPLPPRIISEVERSRPPQYSPELAALLSSNFARAGGKPMKTPYFERPPTLPPRADPNSDQARWFGPFSKRRRVNIHWRYFTSQWKSTYPPLEVSVAARPEEADGTVPISQSVNAPGFNAADIRGVGLQNSGVLQELHALAGPRSRRPPIPRRQRQSLSRQDDSTPSSSSSSLAEAPNRFLRRRYRELLARMPILTYTPPPINNTTSDSVNRGRYTVSLSNAAVTQKLPGELGLPETDIIDEAWLQQSEKDPSITKRLGKRQ